MPGFSVTPVGPFPPVNSEDFPDFLQWQWEGVDVGDTAVDTVNLTGSGVTSVTVGTGENTNVLTVEIEGGGGGSVLSWRTVPGDTDLETGDAENGLSCTATTGEQVITVLADADLDLPVGTAILVYAAGAADVAIEAAVGVTLNVRVALAAGLAGQYATATLIKHAANDWIVCGDLAAA